MPNPNVSRSTALGAIAAALAVPALPAAAQNDLAVVRIGTNPIDPFGTSYYGVERGFFRQAGIDAQLTTLPNGSTITSAVLGGDLDVGIANIVQVANAVAHGLPVQMIAPSALYSAKHSYSNLCVAKNSPFTSAKDLDGATIAVSTLGDFNTLGVSAWLDHNGVPPAREKFVEIKFPEMGAALERGTIAAATIAEPALSAAIAAGQARIFATPYTVIAPEFAAIVWFASKGWLQKNPDVAKRLVAAIYTTAKWANAHPAETAPILARVAKLDPAIVLGMTRAFYATSEDPKMVQAPLDFAFKYGLLPRPVTAAEFIATI
jgi:NitT/TauT family transport system substrate-binding protein